MADQEVAVLEAVTGRIDSPCMDPKDTTMGYPNGKDGLIRLIETVIWRWVANRIHEEVMDQSGIVILETGATLGHHSEIPVRSIQPSRSLV